jgi:hypothetical protein
MSTEVRHGPHPKFKAPLAMASAELMLAKQYPPDVERYETCLTAKGYRVERP